MGGRWKQASRAQNANENIQVRFMAYGVKRRQSWLQTMIWGKSGETQDKTT